MDVSKYDRVISLQCPTCGGTEFASQEPELIRTCIGCGRSLTHDELMQENSENISEHVKEIGAQLVKDVQKDLRATLQKAFRGSKHWRIR